MSADRKTLHSQVPAVPSNTIDAKLLVTQVLPILAIIGVGGY